MFSPCTIDKPVDLLVIAGEHSGDQHAAKVIQELKTKHPGYHICALGGPELQQAGAHLLYDLTASSVVGLFEVLKNYSFFKKLFENTLNWIEAHQPRTICFVDYPGFNLRLAKALHDRGISQKGGGKTQLIYYIAPQIWAWKANRRFKMAEYLNELGVIFPFELDCYKDTNLSTTFVGHPFVSYGHELPLSFNAKGPILLLPGSRKTPVARIFPIMLKAFKYYLQQHPETQAVVIYPSDEIKNILLQELSAHPTLKNNISLRSSQNHISGKAVLTSSGTMSLNCALAGIPGAIVYRANPLTYILGRLLVDINYLGIANILLDQPVYPEYIQGKAKPRVLAQELSECCDKPARREKAQQVAKKLTDLLSEPTDHNAVDWLHKNL